MTNAQLAEAKMDACMFCGRPPKLQHVVQGAEQVHWFAVVCDVPPSQAYRDPTLCRGVSGPRKITAAEAVAAWNHRDQIIAALSEPAGDVEAVARALAVDSDDDPDKFWADYVSGARAAIAAITGGRNG